MNATAKQQAVELLEQASSLLSQAQRLLNEANLLGEWADENEADEVGNLLESASESLQEVVEFCQNSDDDQDDD